MQKGNWKGEGLEFGEVKSFLAKVYWREWIGATSLFTKSRLGTFKIIFNTLIDIKCTNPKCTHSFLQICIARISMWTPSRWRRYRIGPVPFRGTSYPECNVDTIRCACSRGGWWTSPRGKSSPAPSSHPRQPLLSLLPSPAAGCCVTVTDSRKKGRRCLRVCTSSWADFLSGLWKHIHPNGPKRERITLYTKPWGS